MRFRDLTELKSYIAQIEADNHRTRGGWNAAQIFYHLAAAFEGSIEGLPPGFNRVVRSVLRPFRALVTRVRFPPYLPIPAAVADKLAPPKDLDFKEQQQRLIDAIERFETHTEPLAPHPVLGPLSNAEALGFHLRHSEHHLAFVELLGS